MPTGPYIAQTQLTCSGESGPREIWVRIEQPALEPKSEGETEDCWRCNYQLEGLLAASGDEAIYESMAYGQDSVQALMLALVAIGAALAAVPEPLRSTLRLQGSRHLGFPVPSKSQPAVFEILLRWPE